MKLPDMRLDFNETGDWNGLALRLRIEKLIMDAKNGGQEAINILAQKYPDMYVRWVEQGLDEFIKVLDNLNKHFNKPEIPEGYFSLGQYDYGRN